jgi:hypothetical protein
VTFPSLPNNAGISPYRNFAFFDLLLCTTRTLFHRFTGRCSSHSIDCQSEMHAARYEFCTPSKSMGFTFFSSSCTARRNVIEYRATTIQLCVIAMYVDLMLRTFNLLIYDSECCLWCILMPFGCQCIPQFPDRRVTRKTYEIEGNACTDDLTSVICPWCGLFQQEKEATEKRITTAPKGNRPVMKYKPDDTPGRAM